MSKLTDDEIDFLKEYIEKLKEIKRIEQQEYEERRAIRNAIVQKVVAGSVWAAISLIAMRLLEKYLK